MMVGMARTAAARKVLRELNAELASASERSGTSLVWTAADNELLTLIADTIDRHTDLAAHYATADSGVSGRGTTHMLYVHSASTAALCTRAV
jgi:hypothetical protein